MAVTPSEASGPLEATSRAIADGAITDGAVRGVTTQAPAGVHRETHRETHRDAPQLPDDAAVAWWAVGPGAGELRTVRLPPRSADEVSVRTLWTGISRGTEALVARGEVPASERERMRAPFQEGDFPFPVKYGYLNVGVVEAGPPALEGRTVFALFPHQSRYVVPAGAVTPVPESVPPRRAVLAGAVETAVNVLWDARPLVGDRVVVIGAGMIGCAVARLLRGIPGTVVTLVDVDASKRAVAEALDVRFALADSTDGARSDSTDGARSDSTDGASIDGARPHADPGADADLVVEASGTAAGLQLALRLAATDGEVVVASWYGSRAVPLELGADFHSRRLTIRSSQVGAVAPARRSRRTTRDRIALALALLQDPAFDALLGASSSWRRLPEVTAALAEGTAGGLCHTIDWSQAG